MSIDKRAAYLGIRHLAPDCIRELRGCLDMGVTVNDLRNSIKRMDAPAHIIEDTLHALDYMIENPQAGVVRWIEGEIYNFVELEKAGPRAGRGEG